MKFQETLSKAFCISNLIIMLPPVTFLLIELSISRVTRILSIIPRLFSQIRLIFKNNMRKNIVQMRGQDLSDNLTNKIAKTYRLKILEGKRIIFLTNENNKELVKLLGMGLSTQKSPITACRSCPTINQ